MVRAKRIGERYPAASSKVYCTTIRVSFGVHTTNYGSCRLGWKSRYLREMLSCVFCGETIHIPWYLCAFGLQNPERDVVTLFFTAQLCTPASNCKPTREKAVSCRIDLCVSAPSRRVESRVRIHRDRACRVSPWASFQQTLVHLRARYISIDAGDIQPL